MRPPIAILILLLAAGALALVFLPKFRHAGQPNTPAAPPEVATSNAPPKPSAASAQKPGALASLPPATAAPAQDPTQKIERLQSLAMNEDADSLKEILAALTDPNPDIRAAAREAAVQFGDKSAAPLLRAAAENVSDPHEKVALLEAADYLELPPLGIKPSTNRPPRNVQPR